MTGVLLAIIAGPLPAGAGPTEGWWVIQGTVTDWAGSPLAGIRLSDGSRFAFTDSEGRYALVEPSPGTWYVTVAAPPLYEPQTQARYKLVPEWLQESEPVDFQLFYLLGVVDFSPDSFNSLPQNLHVEVQTTAPANAVCMTAYDSASNTETLLSLVEVFPSGSSRWEGSIPVPVGTPEGRYQVVVRGIDCVTGLRQTVERHFSYQYGDGGLLS